MTMASSEISIGTDVYTRDGSKLGRVKAVRGAYFQVDAPMQLDYWLGADCLVSGGAMGRVTLVFDKDDVDDNKHAMEKVDPNSA